MNTGGALFKVRENWIVQFHCMSSSASVQLQTIYYCSVTKSTGPDKEILGAKCVKFQWSGELWLRISLPSPPVWLTGTLTATGAYEGHDFISGIVFGSAVKLFSRRWMEASNSCLPVVLAVMSWETNWKMLRREENKNKNNKTKTKTKKKKMVWSAFMHSFV